METPPEPVVPNPCHGGLPPKPAFCAPCQTGSLDTGAAHATCCAHNAVTALVHAAAQSCDNTTETEVPGLISGTNLSPADVLALALGSSYTALVPSLLRQNISYTPNVWSAYGRPHRDKLTVLRSLSKSIARKRNFVSAEVVFQRLHPRITLEIWKRSDQQIRACWPSRPSPPLWILTLCLCVVLCRCPLFSWPVVALRCPLVSASSRFACSLSCGHMSRSEQLRQLASLATLEDAVAHGVQALLELPPEAATPLSAVAHAPRNADLRPRPRSRSLLPKAAPQSPLWLYFAQIAWSHWSGRQELSWGSA